MLINPFLKHRKNLKKIAASKASKASKVKKSGASKNDTSQNLPKLFKMVIDDLRRIKKTAKDKRGALKNRIINKYKETLDKQCEEQSWTGNIFIFWNIIWNFDVGHFDEAWRLAKLGFKRDLTADDNFFQRPFATVIGDTIYHWAQERFTNKLPISPILSEFIDLMDDGLDVSPLTHAKLLKLQGINISDDEPEAALSYLQKATELDPKIGVKGKINVLKARLQEEQQDGQQDGQPEEQQDGQPEEQ